MMEIYSGTLRLEVVDILANDEHGVVLTKESGTASGESVAWNGVHLWTFCEGRCAGFVAYADAAYQGFWTNGNGTTSRR